MTLAELLEFYDTLPENVRNFLKFQDISNTYLPPEIFEDVPFDEIVSLLADIDRNAAMKLYGPGYPLYA